MLKRPLISKNDPTNKTSYIAIEKYYEAISKAKDAKDSIRYHKDIIAELRKEIRHNDREICSLKKKNKELMEIIEKNNIQI